MAKFRRLNWLIMVLLHSQTEPRVALCWRLEIQWLGRVMLKMKGMRFPKEIILLCIRWYAAYPLSYRNLEEMM